MNLNRISADSHRYPSILKGLILQARGFSFAFANPVNRRKAFFLAIINFISR